MADTIWQLRVIEKLKLCSIWRLKIQEKVKILLKLEYIGFRGR